MAGLTNSHSPLPGFPRVSAVKYLPNCVHMAFDKVLSLPGFFGVTTPLTNLVDRFRTIDNLVKRFILFTNWSDSSFS